MVSDLSDTALLFLMVFFFPKIVLKSFFLFCIFFWMTLPNNDPLLLMAFFSPMMVLDVSALVNKSASSISSLGDETALLFLMVFFFPKMVPISFFFFFIFCWIRLPMLNPLALDLSVLAIIFTSSISFFGDVAESNTALLFLMVFFFPKMALISFFLICIFFLMRLPMS